MCDTRQPGSEEAVLANAHRKLQGLEGDKADTVVARFLLFFLNLQFGL
jgi:hypothetical protein